MKKRIVSLFMALVMTLSLLPATVWANQDAVQTAQTDAAAETVTGDVSLTEEKEEPEEKEETTSQEKTADETPSQEDTVQEETDQIQPDTNAAEGTALLKELRLANGPDWVNSAKQYLNMNETYPIPIIPGRTYTASIDDYYSSLYAWATVADGCTVTVNGTKVQSGMSDDKGTWISGNIAGPESQTITVVVTPTSGESQTYTVTLKKMTTLGNISLTADGETVPLYLVENGKVTNVNKFYRDKYQYHATISVTVALQLSVTPTFENYSILLNDQVVTPPCTVKLDDEKSQTLIVKAKSDTAAASPRAYTITLDKKGLARTSVSVTPGNATVAIYDSNNVRIWPDADGVFALMEGEKYTYIATCSGYKGIKREFTAGAENAELSISLESAPSVSHGKDVSSSWPAFRGGNDNNGVVNFKTPTRRDKAALSWASKIGDGYDKEAVSCPILITQDGYDYLIVYSGAKIYKVDAITGQTVAAGTMQDASAYAINSPTYGDGMIFVGLSDGRVQAFDANTLESLWVYADPLEGQPNCPIVYHNGYVYTGFWKGEEKNANFVCLSATDEDPNDTDEEKLATWTYTTKGGYYWAGAYVCDNYLLVTTDDGADGYSSQTGKLLCLNPTTGERLDEINNLHGDARSSIAEENGVYYFTSKGGYFYQATVTATESGYELAVRELALENGTTGIPMSTSTPVVYKGRAYVGVSGSSQFTAYSGHNITVIDLKSWKIAYRVETKGYPQTSGLLTTAYESVDRCTYVYFIDNFTPGVLRVLKDKPGQTEPILTEKEAYVEDGVDKVKMTAPVLFEPAGHQAQYAICSPIADQYGTLYFKNDSGYLMALTNAVKSVKITSGPDKTVYGVNEAFDPAGMKLTVTYANGISRELPACHTIGGKTVNFITWNKTVTKEDTTFFLEFPYADFYYYSGQKQGDDVKPPIELITISLEVNKNRKGDLNGDGVTDVYDLQRLYEHCNGINGFTGNELADAGLKNGILEVQNLYSFLTTGRWDSSEKAG